jgi:glycogen debranching enzyme
MPIRFAADVCQDLAASLAREWLETDGLGGWASSTLAGANTRRYHGMLVAATAPPVGRAVLVSRLDETVLLGGARHELATALFPGAISPHGFRQVESFERDPFPSWTLQADGAVVRRTVVAPNGGLAGRSAVVVVYELLDVPATLQDPEVLEIELRPFLAGRDYHALGHRDERPLTARFAHGVLRCDPAPGQPTVYVAVPGGRFEAAPDWWYRFELPAEEARGFDHQEDLWTPGVIKVRLVTGQPLAVVLSLADPLVALAATAPTALAPAPPLNAQQLSTAVLELVTGERRRRSALFGRSALATVPLGELGELAQALVLAADQHLVARPTKGQSASRRATDPRTIIAGYHWFGDWGRDTMIALPGLCMVTGRLDEAGAVLRSFAGSLSQGMLPNRFLDSGADVVGAAEYNTVDATLWFFLAVQAYLAAADAESARVAAELAASAYRRRHSDGSELAQPHHALVRDVLLPALREVIAWHDRGTRFGIRVDDDGLLAAGEPGVQLTWMDAKVGEWVVTPRQGKAVEIQALWANALAVLGGLERRFGDAVAAEGLARRAAAVVARAGELFWNPTAGCLYDVIGPEGRPDPAIRPNQIFAVSLPLPLVTGARAHAVLAVVEQRLLTPVGLRSLDPADPAYRPAYRGNAEERDGAYHQGTVWSWLLGPYVEALVRLRGEEGRRQARGLLAGLEQHLTEAGIGTVAEIFDGNATVATGLPGATPHHRPDGCIAQAWGVGEWLRAVALATTGGPLNG